MFKVLIVEAQQVTADAFVRYIERLASFTIVGQASNGADTLHRLSSEQVDLVLLDVYLPDMSGLDLLRRIRAGGNPVDVIAVTRARDLSVVQAAVTFGAMQYMINPFTFATVRQKLEGYQRYRSILARKPTDGQHDIDHLLYALRGLTTDTLPKGISAESLQAVVTAFRQAGGGVRMSAVEVAGISGMSRVTARRYLEYLVESGRAERTARYRGAGRPEFEYRLEYQHHELRAEESAPVLPGRPALAGDGRQLGRSHRPQLAPQGALPTPGHYEQNSDQKHMTNASSL
jgi:response regulator of citrate/malate metabolism